MPRRTLAVLAAVLSASVALAAGVIGGAFAHRGGGGSAGAARGTTGPTGPFGHHRPGGRPFGRGIDADAFAVLRDVRSALAAKAPGIAKPILDKAVADGSISQASADRLAKLIADKRLSRADAEALFKDTKAAPVSFEIQAAISREAPGIVKPILDKAVDDKKLTQAQADRLLAAAAWRMRGPGFHPGGPGGRRHP
jgi:hypothetical protein